LPSNAPPDFRRHSFPLTATLCVCGNGGSAAIANRLLCHFARGIRTGTVHPPEVVSLSAHVELITAIGNDLDLANIFARQLRASARAAMPAPRSIRMWFMSPATVAAPHPSEGLTASPRALMGTRNTSATERYRRGPHCF
jgi:hypothetical protein